MSILGSPNYTNFHLQIFYNNNNKLTKLNLKMSISNNWIVLSKRFPQGTTIPMEIQSILSRTPPEVFESLMVSFAGDINMVLIVLKYQGDMVYNYAIGKSISWVTLSGCIMVYRRNLIFRNANEFRIYTGMDRYYKEYFTRSYVRQWLGLLNQKYQYNTGRLGQPQPRNINGERISDNYARLTYIITYEKPKMMVADHHCITLDDAKIHLPYQEQDLDILGHASTVGETMKRWLM